MKTLFLDTNIVLDLIEEREPFCNDAVRLFSMAYNKQVKLYVSPITFSTAAYILEKHGNSADVNKCLTHLRQLVSVATTNERTIDDALVSQFDDFEDAMQYYTAIACKADAIITRNGKDFQKSKLPVLTAGEWLEW